MISAYFPRIFNHSEISAILGRDWIFVEGVCPLEREKNHQIRPKGRFQPHILKLRTIPVLTILDINECLRTESECSAAPDGNKCCDLTTSTCVNTPGSFQCICLPGFTGVNGECVGRWAIPFLPAPFQYKIILSLSTLQHHYLPSIKKVRSGAVKQK